MKLFAYWAMPELGLIPAEPRVSVAVFCFGLPEVLGDDPFRPVSAGISTVRKLSPGAVALQAKVAGNYVNAFLARWQAVGRGHDDAILLDESGHVVEGALSNVFFASGGALVTPRLSSALAGITRDSVIRIASDEGIDIIESRFTRDEVYICDEAFFSGTAAEITPIVDLDSRTIGTGKPGNITKRIQDIFFDTVKGKNKKYSDWLTYI